MSKQASNEHECECCGELSATTRGSYMVHGRTYEGWRCKECADHEDVDGKGDGPMEAWAR